MYQTVYQNEAGYLYSQTHTNAPQAMLDNAEINPGKVSSSVRFLHYADCLDVSNENRKLQAAHVTPH